MAIHRQTPEEQVSAETDLAILEKDPEQGYEYFDSRIYMLTSIPTSR
jgi:hypothetical protein